jgi:hypothetical protein
MSPKVTFLYDNQADMFAEPEVEVNQWWDYHKDRMSAYGVPSPSNTYQPMVPALLGHLFKKQISKCFGRAHLHTGGSGELWERALPFYSPTIVSTQAHLNKALQTLHRPYHLNRVTV